MAKLEIIESTGKGYAERLREAGIHSTDALLRAAATSQGREELEHLTGIGREDIRDWVQRADLMRVRGVGTEYSKLLKRAGVVTIRDLRRRNPDRLYEKVIRVNREQRLVARPPGRSAIDSWVRCAGELPGDPYPPPRKASG